MIKTLKVCLATILIFFSLHLSAENLIEFDSQKSSIGESLIVIESLELWVDPRAEKLSENVYRNPGGCAGCDFMFAKANYYIGIRLSDSLILKYRPSSYQDRAIVWWVPTSYEGGELQTVPDFVVNGDVHAGEVLNEVGDVAYKYLRLINAARTGVPLTNNEGTSCYRYSMRGFYSENSKIVSNIQWPSRQVTCFN